MDSLPRCRIDSVSRSVLVAMLETRSPRLHVELAQLSESFFCMSQDLSMKALIVLFAVCYLILDLSYVDIVNYIK